MSYATTGQVQELMARINSNAAYSGSTAPTSTQATEMIAGVSAEIDMHLASVGYSIPVTTPATFLTWLGHVNAYGAVAEVLKSMFPESLQNANGGPVIPAWSFWEKRYQDALKAIDDRTIVSPTAPMSSDSLARNYLTDNPDNDPLADGTTDGQQPVFSLGKVF